MKKRLLLKLINFWPPYLGAGIKVKYMAKDMRVIEVEMKLRFWNRNYVGTHFGGSLFSMVDPFYMLMLVTHLGRDYIVWDKAATIQFKSPGRGKVCARFELTEEEVQRVKALADKGDKVEPVYHVTIKDEQNNVVAEVAKTLYVRKK